VASASSTYRRRKHGVSGHPSLASKHPTIESPILASACPIVPSARDTRESSCAPKACFRNSRSLAVSREIIHGITVEQPSGIGGTALGCGVIFMLLVEGIDIYMLSSKRSESTLLLLDSLSTAPLGGAQFNPWITALSLLGKQRKHIVTIGQFTNNRS
jgi:hypothetical protein